MGEFVKVAEKKDVPKGKAAAIELKGKKIALFFVNDQYYAIDDECSHAGGPLSEGQMEGTVVTCPWHCATFDITNGQALSAPAFEGVKCYNIQIEGENIKIEI